jgi:hypothetical protein
MARESNQSAGGLIIGSDETHLSNVADNNSSKSQGAEKERKPDAAEASRDTGGGSHFSPGRFQRELLLAVLLLAVVLMGTGVNGQEALCGANGGACPGANSHRGGLPEQVVSGSSQVGYVGTPFLLHYERGFFAFSFSIQC